MRAHAGEHIVVDGRHFGQPSRAGEILETSEFGNVWFARVRWDNGLESVVVLDEPEVKPVF